MKIEQKVKVINNFNYIFLKVSSLRQDVIFGDNQFISKHTFTYKILQYTCFN